MKFGIGVRSIYSALIFFGLVLGMQACGGGSSPPASAAPTASAVSISDNNGGTAAFGDILTAAYTYNDVNGDVEGATTFIWLRNGTAISGATASTYTLTVPDTEQMITLSVTPVAATGITTGAAVTSTGIAIDVLANQDASGLYNGTATVDANTDITDLRGMIYNSRFLFFSETGTPHVLYDGTITSITKNNYTATVNVYEDGVKTQTDVAVTGNVLTADNISGTIGVEGDVGNHNGTFSLTFNTKYNEGATILRITQNIDGHEYTGNTYGTVNFPTTGIFVDTLQYAIQSTDGTVCGFLENYSIPDSTVNIYAINNIEILDQGGNTCLDTYEGIGYSGLVSLVDDSVDGVDSRILIAYTNGTNSVFGFLLK